LFFRLTVVHSECRSGANSEYLFSPRSPADMRGLCALQQARARKLGLEGLVCKRIDMPYRARRSKHWLKLKNRAHPAIMRVKEAFEEKRRRSIR
jgi:ATP-dependent DNA ligase